MATTVFSLLLLLGSLLCVIGGLRIVRLNARSTPYRLYFLLMLCLSSILMILFIMLGIMKSSIGWTTVIVLQLLWVFAHTLLIHLLILVVNHRIGKKRTFFLVLYAPAIVFCIISSFALFFGVRTFYTDSIAEIFSHSSFIAVIIVSLVVVIPAAKTKETKRLSAMLIRTLLLTVLFWVSLWVLQHFLFNYVLHLESFSLVFLLVLLADILHEPFKGDAAKIPVKMHAVHIIVSALLYLMFSVLQIHVALLTDIAEFLNLELQTLRGVITQLQLISSVYLVIFGQKPGFLVSVVFTAANVFSSLIYVIRTDSSDPIPGIIAYLGILILLFILREYQKNALKHISRIEEQRLQLEQSDRKLHALAYYDSLTGLPSRQFFLQRLRDSLMHAAEHSKQLAVLFIDLDSFKSINDTAGHSTGDAVLKRLPNIVRPCLEERDMLSRFGGDEFIILLQDIENGERAIDVANCILQALKKPITVAGHEYFVSASIGLALYPLDGDSIHTLIRNADIAMYAAKKQGKNQFVCSSHELQQRVTIAMQLTNSLHRALQKGELSLQYQLQVKTDTQEIVGMEALVRWNHEIEGPIEPKVFIPMAEKTALIRPIGLWVVEQALNQRKALQHLSSKPLSVGVNVSVSQLKDGSFVEAIEHLLEKTDTQPNLLQIEITESITSSDEHDILQQLNQMKALGVILAIDDFGTGHSSFSRLSSFPIDILKIDMEFVQGIESESKKERAIIKSIIQLAKNLGKTVCAEGVESEVQYQYLKNQGCDTIQGFYFYKPMNGDAIEQILQQKKVLSKTSLT